MKIITLTNKDQTEILRGKESFNYMFEEQIIELLKNNFDLEDSLYLLAKRGGLFAGFCSVDSDWWEDSYFFIREILVDSAFRKQGVGEKLMMKCMQHAQKCGAVGIITQTDFNNAPMKNLCKKLGFREWDNPEWKEGITYKLVF